MPLDLTNFFQNSQILNNNDKQLIINWLPNKPKKINLLFNSNINGDSFETFLKNSNGKYPTLVIIETSKGVKFGGYTSKPWKEEKVTDENAFVFSLLSKKKYSIKNPSNAFGLYDIKHNFGCLVFGWGDNAIVIYTQCTSRSENYVRNETYNISEKAELNGGEEKFTVKCYELFNINY